MPKLTESALEAIVGGTVLAAAVEESDVQVSAEVFDIVMLAGQGMPVTPTRVLAVLGEKYYRTPWTPSVQAGEAEAQYHNYKNSIDAVTLHTRWAVEVLAEMRKARASADPTADLDQIAEAYRSSVEVLSRKIRLEAESGDRTGIARLAGELRETLESASTFFGKPVGKHVRVTAISSAEVKATLNVNAADAYSSWNGSADDLVAVDAEFLEETG